MAEQRSDGKPIGEATDHRGLGGDPEWQSFNYPTLAEAYKVAALDGLNKL